MLSEVGAGTETNMESQNLDLNEISDPKLHKLLRSNDLVIEKYHLDMFSHWESKTPNEPSKIEVEKDPNQTIKKLFKMVTKASLDNRYRDALFLSGQILQQITDFKVAKLSKMPKPAWNWLVQLLVYGWNESPVLLDQIFQVLYTVVTKQTKKYFHSYSAFKPSCLLRRNTISDEASPLAKTLLIPINNFHRMLKTFGFDKDPTFQPSLPDVKMEEKTRMKRMALEKKQWLDPKMRKPWEKEPKKEKKQEVKENKKEKEKGVNKEPDFSEKQEKDKKGEEGEDAKVFPLRNLVYLCHLMAAMVVTRLGWILSL